MCKVIQFSSTCLHTQTYYRHILMTMLFAHFMVCKRAISLNTYMHLHTYVGMYLSLHFLLLIQSPSCHRKKGMVHPGQIETENYLRTHSVFSLDALLWTVEQSQCTRIEHANSTQEGPRCVKGFEPGTFLL